MTTKIKSEKSLGLTTEEVEKLQRKFGKNELTKEKKETLFHKIIDVLSEPMFILLIIASIIYFILGEPRDGAIMLIFVIGIIGIDVIQEWKTDKTIKALKDLSAPHSKVIRDNKETIINSADLVPGDVLLIEEGVKIPADGIVIKANDLRIDESTLTGEAEGVWKTVNALNEDSQEYWKKDYCYGGTLVIQGSGMILVDKIGIETEYGKIGKNVAEAPDIPTPLQKETSKLVKICASIAVVLFILVGIITYLNLSDHGLKDRIIESILSGITLSMAMIPEEFPVILTVFLSMGAWRLAKKKSLVRRMPSVETLGAVSVLCVDKTGTITMNEMEVSTAWCRDKEENLCRTMGLACETEPYDPMEKAMLKYCVEKNICKDKLFSGELITEYSFTNERKMMGHVWNTDGEIIIAAKGSAENIIDICDLNEEEKKEVNLKMLEMSKLGLRVIAVGQQKIGEIENIPSTIEECNLKLLGLIGLQDPPRENVKDDIKKCINAGIRVVMITGDNGITASAIARKIGIPNSDKIITGDELNNISDEELKEKVKDTSIFSRVVPEHKMRIVKAFKANGHIVAMTGDGVNDAAALKYADIGVAMGLRGSEVSREAADLILLDDNFSTIVDTIKDGRRIYDNIKKAVGYVFTIHIPIALASLVAPFLGINSAALLLLLPIHVVLLELIIDPTCSIVLERQPAENDIMSRKPRNPKEGILTVKTLLKSVIQGVVIFIASFSVYYLYVNSNAELARTMGLVVIFFANIVLVQVNSSNKEFAYKSFMKLRKDPVMWLVILGTVIGVLIMLYTPLAVFLKLAPLTFKELFIAIGIAIVSVGWYEIVKRFI